MALAHKVFPVQVKVADPDQGIIEAIVSVFSNVDGGREVVDPGFFADDLKTRRTTDGRPKMKGAWGHDWNTPVAKTLDAAELYPGDARLPAEIADLGGLWVKGQFNLDTQRGREGFSDVKGQYVDEFSIGYVTSKDAYDADGIRHLQKGTTYEWSPVLAGMNPLTSAMAVKTMPGADPATSGSPTCPFCDSGEDASDADCICTTDCGAASCGARAKAVEAIDQKWGWLTTEAEYLALPDGAKFALYYDLQAVGPTVGSKAAWSAAYIASLEDDCFAAVDSDGRHYPHHAKGEGGSGTGGTVDEPHLKAALSRLGDPSNTQAGKGHINAHAKKLGIGDDGKAARRVDRKQYGVAHVGMGWGNPFAGNLPGSYEELQEDLGECAAELLGSWLVGPLAGMVEPFEIHDDTAVCIIGTFPAEVLLFVCPDAWDDADDGFYLRVPYTVEDGEPVYGTPTLQRPAFLPAGGAAPLETSSRLAGRLRDAALAVKVLSARKEGRMISGQNREHLQTAMDHMSTAQDHLQTMMDASDPDPNAAVLTSVTNPGIQLAGLSNADLWARSNRILLSTLGVAV